MVTAKKTRSGSSRAKKSAPDAASRAPGKTPGEIDKSKVQGEGDYASAREFNREEREFVTSHDTEDLARRAAPGDSAQAEELEAAERKGKARARPDPDAEQPAADAAHKADDGQEAHERPQGTADDDDEESDAGEHGRRT